MSSFLKKQTLFFFILLLSACTSNQMLQNKTLLAPDLVIKNVTIIDAKNGLQKGKTVLIKGNRILKVGDVKAIQFAKNSKVIDGKGKFLIPGLWDAHVHLTFEKALTPAMFRLFLAYGITSVRDTGGLLHLITPERDKAQKDTKNSPRVMISGPLLDGIPTVYDGSSIFNPHIGIGSGTAAEAEQLVDKMLAADVDLLKAYEMLTPEAFKAIINKGKANGIPITGHVPLSMDVIEASNAGMSSMEHLRNLEFACASDWEALLEKRQKMLFDGKNEKGSILRRNIHKAQRSHAIGNQDKTRRDKVLKHLANNETWQIPTLTITTAASERFNLRSDWQATFNQLPTSVKQVWSKGAKEYAKSPVSEADANRSQWAFEMISHLKKANVDIMAGTDCPIFFLTPGYSLHEELALLVKGGLSPLEAIEAATTKPAKYFKLEKELGLIAEGMLADLVLLNANPLEDIRNTLKINAVMRDGKWHNRAALDQLLVD